MSRLSHPECHDDLLNYRLKRLFMLGGAPAVRLCEGAYGIARFEWRVVAALVEHGAMSPMDLVRCTGFDQAKVSRCVAALETKSLVERKAAVREGARWELRATPAGQALYAGLFPQLAAINRKLMEALTEEEAVALDAALDKLTARAGEILRQGGGVAVKTERRLGGARRVWRAANP